MHPPGRSLSETLAEDTEKSLLADRLGFDEFWCGEHHSSGWEMIASPEMFLAAAAMVTHRIKLGTGVTVLSSDDPIRVYQRFATIDALSSGRAEITAGRGSFTESCSPIFQRSQMESLSAIWMARWRITRTLASESPRNPATSALARSS